MQLTDLLHHVSRIFTPPPRAAGGRPTMIIPSLRDIRDARQASKVQGQCQQCVQQLVPHLYVWQKQPPERSTLKLWNVDTASFVGMSVEDFTNFLMANFVLRTADGKESLLDKTVAVQIWASSVEPGSPLPEANWQIETDLKRRAARLKEGGK